VRVYVCARTIGGARPTQYARGDGYERRPTSSSTFAAIPAPLPPSLVRRFIIPRCTASTVLPRRRK